MFKKLKIIRQIKRLRKTSVNKAHLRALRSKLEERIKLDPVTLVTKYPQERLLLAEQWLIFINFLKRMRFAPVMIIIALIIISTGGGVALASQNSLPGDALYGAKIMTENVYSVFIIGVDSKINRNLELAERRLLEVKELAELAELAEENRLNESDKVEKVIEKYRERLDKVFVKTKEAMVEGRDIDEMLEKIAETTIKHQAVLAEVYEKVPEQAKESIEKAMNENMREHHDALNIISEKKQDEVRDRVKRKTKDVRNKLEKFRERGVPIPKIDRDKDKAESDDTDIYNDNRDRKNDEELDDEDDDEEDSEEDDEDEDSDGAENESEENKKI